DPRPRRSHRLWARASLHRSRGPGAGAATPARAMRSLPSCRGLEGGPCAVADHGTGAGSGRARLDLSFTCLNDDHRGEHFTNNREGVSRGPRGRRRMSSTRPCLAGPFSVMLDGIVPPTSLKLDHARYVLTLDAQRRIIRDGSILTEAGRITRVGKADDLASAQADRVIDAHDLVVAPGFVNAHMHISYAHPVRGLFPDDLGSPLVHVFALQAAMTEEEEYHASLLALVELARNGTVCLLDPGSTKFPDACLQAYQDAGLPIVLGEGVTDGEAPWTLPRFATAEAVRRTEAFIDTWNGRLEGRLRAWAMPFSPETCSAELLRALKRVADERRTGLTLHHGSGVEARQSYR